MPATTSQFGDLLDMRVTKVYDDEYEQLFNQDNPLDILYKVEDTKRAYDIETQVGAFGDIGQFTGTIGYDEVYQGYDTQYNVVEFAGGFKAQRLLIDTDQFNVIEDKAKALGEAAWRSIAKDAMNTFINSFTVAMPGPGGTGDALSLCNNSHTSTAVTNTFDNLYTTALSATQVETIRQAFMRTRNDRNDIISIIPDLLVVPPELQQTAYEIIASSGKVDTANNNANFLMGKYKVYSSPWLTSSTDWFMVSTAHMKRWLKWKWLTKPEFGRDVDFDTLLRKYYVYFARAKGWSDWRFIIGSDV